MTIVPDCVVSGRLAGRQLTADPVAGLDPSRATDRPRPHRREPRRDIVRPGLPTFLVLSLVLAVLAGACGSGAPAQPQARMRSEIGRAYATLFDFADHDVKTKMAVIQDGTVLHSAITEALSSPLAAKAAGAKVMAVKLLPKTRCDEAVLPSPCARVTYDLLGPSGRPLFITPSTGYAVEVRDRWLVATSTICGLLGLFYSASGRPGRPPGC